MDTVVAYQGRLFSMDHRRRSCRKSVCAQEACFDGNVKLYGSPQDYALEADVADAEALRFFEKLRTMGGGT